MKCKKSGGGGKGDFEKSRFDWVFLNAGVPRQELVILKDISFRAIFDYMKLIRSAP